MIDKTVVVKTEWSGKQLFTVWHEDKIGANGARPVVSFGIKKAKAILDHLEELKAYVEEHDE